MGWCSAEKDAVLENSIRTDVHSPGRFRVLGSMANTPDFSKAFNCKPGDPMFPAENMCKVW
jgi:predicted metalloendopeptidase